MLVGLTGGIGAGKSTVARQLARLGGRVVDADAVARQVVDPADPRAGPLLAELRDLLGDDAFGPDGSLDRIAVAGLVFSDPALLAMYNALLRPTLIAAMTSALATAHAEANGMPVVHEIPLLNSRTSQLPWVYDTVVTIEARMKERITRLTRDRHYSPDEARTRIAAQGSEEERTAVADTVLRNDGTLVDLENQVSRLWQVWLADQPSLR